MAKNTAINTKKAMTDQSMLWGSPVPFWDLWGLRLMFAGGVLGILALAVSLVSSFVLYRVADKVQAEADQHIAEAKVAAAKAQENTERLKAENLSLQAIIAPRSLSIEQQTKLANALKPFAGAKVVIASPPMDGEALGLAQQILASLEAAGIVPVNMIGRLGHVAGFAFGIHMTGRVSGNNAELMTKLHDELTSFGQLVVASEGNAAQPLLTYPGGDFPDAKSAAVAIFIGAKPVPIMK